MNLFEHASWLWHTAYNTAEHVYVDFYEHMTVDTPAKTYQMYISADTNYAVYVNGTLVDFGQYADYEAYKVYDTITLTGIVPGKNEIRVTVYSCGRDFSTYRIGQPGVIYEIYADGALCLASCEKTEMALNPCYQQGAVDEISSQLGFTHHYDATVEHLPLARIPAQIINKSKTLYPRPIKKLSVGENCRTMLYAQGVFMDSREENLSPSLKMQRAFLSTREAHTLSDGPVSPYFPQEKGVLFHRGNCADAADGLFLTFDLGVESAGVFSIDIDVPKDTQILVSWGEHLDDLRPRAQIGGGHWTMCYKAPAGRHSFVCPFLRLGLRYMQVHIYTESATLYYAGIKPTDYPVSDVPYFRCSDHLHNKIYEVCLRTLHTCMHEHYEDCPWREQALYSMDSRNQMLCGYYTFGEYEFPKASIRLMAKSLREDGMLELCSPAVVSVTIPCFSLIFVTLLQEYLLYSGDIDFIREMMPTSRTILSAFAAQLNNSEKLLMCRAEAKYWNFYEWQNGLEGAWGGIPEEDLTYDAPMNAFYSMALRSAAKLEEALGNADAASDYNTLKSDLDGRMHRLFWDSERGVYTSFVKMGKAYHHAELTNALMVYADVCPADCEASVLAALTNQTLLPVTLSHSIFKYEALLRDPQKYGKYVFDEIADIFGKMLFNGATTFYETAEGSRNGAGSLCHGWSAIPSYLYHAYVLGLKPTGNGFSTYEIKPVTAGIHDAEGLVVTPVGEIKL
ncbi:MAG: hypothetical protein J6S76_00060 [Clostridia bacterium]|nr:hypothetical protein [Clostridia bacterium]